MKVNWKPGTMIYPLPAVLVSCGNEEVGTGIMTASWTGTVCTNPAMCYVSVRRERHSYELIRSTMQFTINLTTEEMARATDWCGVRSGRDHDKWQASGLTPLPGVAVDCPSVEQSPISIECRVKQILELGSHDMFIAEVVNVVVDDRYLDTATGELRLDRANLLAYSHGHYYGLGRHIGRFGWSVKKPKRKSKKV